MGATAALLLAGGLTLQAQTAAELLEQAEEAYCVYDFDEASRLLAQAHKKARGASADFTERYDALKSRVTMADNFLNRIERIEVIDSLSVPRRDFFKHYRLPKSAGALRDGTALPQRESAGVDYVFTNEGEDYKLWAAPDSTGRTRLVESSLLTDGTWSAPTPLDDTLPEGSDALYPFMMSDGVTLYYADNGPNSLGGYDIMVATRDASDGTFLQPSNLGFPYNSPYDDYMLAIDEENGVGWWATDRNRLDGLLTVYLFKTNDMRTNYSPDEPELTDRARITDYIATQPEDADYDELLATIRAIDPSARERKAQFDFRAPGGKRYTRYDQLPSPAAHKAMKAYQDLLAKENGTRTALDSYRRQYARQRTTALEKAILRHESDLEKMASQLTEARNGVLRTL